MRLLIVTQVVDTEDTTLGFFVRWIEEFAKHVEHIEVICLKSGKFDLPENVRVHSLGKECGAASRVVYAWRFLSLAWRLRGDYDTVFVHMNPEYVVIGGPLWRLLGKHIGLWYVHRSVDLKLRVATLFAHNIFTASQEGFRLATPKLHVMGHGIDTAAFRTTIQTIGTPVRIVSVGRITPIKNLDTLIEVVALLKEREVAATATFIGAPVQPSDSAYQESLVALATTRGVEKEIYFAGGVPHAELPEQYRHFDISVNLSPTGGMDKAVLESMAAGLLVFVSNQTFTELLGSHAGMLTFAEKDATDCADKIAALVKTPEKVRQMCTDLQQRVEVMSLQSLISRVISFL